MKTLISSKSNLVKIILTLIITTISILNALSVPAETTDKAIICDNMEQFDEPCPHTRDFSHELGHA